MISTKAGERLSLYEDLMVTDCEIVNPTCRLTQDGVYVHGSAEWHAVMITVGGVEINVDDLIDPDTVSDRIAIAAENQYPDHGGAITWDQYESEA